MLFHSAGKGTTEADNIVDTVHLAVWVFRQKGSEHSLAMISSSQDFFVTQFQIGVSLQGVVWSVLKAHIEKKFLLPLVFLLNKSQSSIIPYKSSDYTEQNEYNLKITKKITDLDRYW